jgi:hypothetical protein
MREHVEIQVSLVRLRSPLVSARAPSCSDEGEAIDPQQDRRHFGDARHQGIQGFAAGSPRAIELRAPAGRRSHSSEGESAYRTRTMSESRVFGYETLSSSEASLRGLAISTTAFGLNGVPELCLAWPKRPAKDPTPVRRHGDRLDALLPAT